MQQPSLRVVLMMYLAFISCSTGVLPGVTMAGFMHCGSTAASKSTCACRTEIWHIRYLATQSLSP